MFKATTQLGARLCESSSKSTSWNHLLGVERWRLRDSNPGCHSHMRNCLRFVSNAVEMFPGYHSHMSSSLKLWCRFWDSMRLGFSELWRVRTIFYSILINGQSGAKFLPTRRLRQDNPIFPYLYLICAESLISLLNNAENSFNIKEIKVAKYSLASHPRNPRNLWNHCWARNQQTQNEKNFQL